LTTECFDHACTCRYTNPERTIIYIKWHDASYQRGECSIDDLKSEVILESAGLLIQETDTEYCLSLDFYPRQMTWRHIEHIPKVMVLEVVKFPLPEKKREE